jgi:hypothetical protein
MKDNKTENTSDAKRGGYLPKSVPDAVAHAQGVFGLPASGANRSKKIPLLASGQSSAYS